MTWRALLTIALMSLLGVLCSPSICHAQMSPEQQFVEGQKRYDEGDYEGALPFFRNAFQRSGSPNARLQVARCLVKLEQLVRAYEEMYGTLELATEKAQTDRKYAHTRDAASAELAVLEPKIGKLVVDFSEEYTDAELYLDGRRVEERQYGTAIVVMPGSIELEAHASDKESLRQTIDISGGETKNLSLVLEDTAIDAPVNGDEPEFELGIIRMAGIGVAGFGVAAMVVFAITGSMAKSKFKELEDECGGVRCSDPKYADTVDSGKTLSLVANISAGVGGAALIAGALMIVFGEPDEPDGEPSASLEPVPGGAVFRFGGAF